MELVLVWAIAFPLFMLQPPKTPTWLNVPKIPCMCCVTIFHWTIDSTLKDNCKSPSCCSIRAHALRQGGSL